MHELSIARAVVTTVVDATTRQRLAGARVNRVQVRLGPHCGVVAESLQFCWDIVTDATPLAGAVQVDRVSGPDVDPRLLEVGEVELDDAPAVAS